MKKARCPFLRLLFPAMVVMLFLIQSAAAGTESAQGKAEEILGAESCSDYDWTLSSDGTYWQVLNVSYVAYPVNTAYQTMSIFVPAAYMEKDASGKVVFTDSAVKGYTVNTAPILYLCEAPGYSEWTADSRADTQAIAGGFIAVSPGHRGKGTTSIDSAGKTYYDGKSPWCLVDLKAGIRYLRLNDRALPGDSNLIVSSAASGGGAMSTFLACCANDPVYDAYLEEAGAVMSVGDEIYASNCYCPITNVANSDAAYEWYFGTKAHLETLGCTDFQVMLSGYLSGAFAGYLGRLGYTEKQFEEILVDQLEWSVNYYLDELKAGEAQVEWDDEAVFKDANHPTLDEIAANYIAGHYTKTGGMPGMPPGGGMGGPPGGDVSAMTGGPGGGMPSGDMAGPEGGMPGGPPGGMMPGGGNTEGRDISRWLAWDRAARKAVITDLKNFRNYSSRQKAVTSFDGLNGKATENQVFGDRQSDFKHFSNAIFNVLTAHRKNLKAAWTDADTKNTGYASFDEFYATFKSDVAGGDRDAFGNDIADLYNPMLFIDTDTAHLNGDPAKHVRIRYGTADANTSLPVITLMGLALERKGGVDLDFEYVWEGGHGNIEQDNQTLYEWVDGICASAGKKSASR